MALGATGCAGTAVTAGGCIDRQTEFVLKRVIDDAYLQRLWTEGSTRAHIDGPLLSEPVSIAVDYDGTIVIADRLQGRLLRLRSPGDRRETQPLLEISRTLFPYPRAVQFDAAGNTYVIESEESRIAVLNQRFQFEDWLPAPPFDALGLVPGRLTGVAFSPLGDMFIPDQTNGRVYRYDITGRYLSVLGSADDPWGQLTRPAGIACDPSDGTIYVCDPGAGRVVVYDPSGTAQAIIGGNDLKDPQAIAVNQKGQSVVADREAHALFMYSREGDLLRRLNGRDLDMEDFAGPTDIALADSTLWIADPARGHILEIGLRLLSDN